MLKRGVVVLLAMALGSLGSGVAGAQAAPTVSFRTAWAVNCPACQAPVVAGTTAFTVDRVGPDNGEQRFSSTVRTFGSTTGAVGWTHSLGTVSDSAVDAVSGGVVYVHSALPDGVGRVTALDASTGRVRWSTVPPGRGFVRGVAVDGPGVFVVNAGPQASTSLHVTRYDQSGAAVWTKRDNRWAGAFTLGAGNLYVWSTVFVPPGSQRDFLTVYRETDGQSSLVFHTRNQAASAVTKTVYAHGLVYAVEYAQGSGSGFETLVVDPATGALAWRANGTNAIAVGDTVAIDGSGDYSSSLQSELSGYDPVTGARLWGPIGNTGYDPVIVGSTFYTTNFAAAVGRSRVQARSLTTGRLEGSAAFGRERLWGITASGRRVYVVSGDNLYALIPHSS